MTRDLEIEYAVTVEACEPDELRETERVKSGVISFHETGGGMNCPEIEVCCDDEAILLDFIYDGWVGDGGDVEWFGWVASQVREVGIDATTRNAILSRIQKLPSVEARSSLLADLENARSDSQLEEVDEAVSEAEAERRREKAAVTHAPACPYLDRLDVVCGCEVDAGIREAREAAFTVGGVAVEAGRDLVGADLAPLMVPAPVYQADEEGEPMDPPVREILVHLNVVLPMSDERSVEEIVALIDGAIEVGLSGDSEDPLTYTIPMAEEV